MAENSRIKSETYDYFEEWASLLVSQLNMFNKSLNYAQAKGNISVDDANFIREMFR